MMTIWLDEIDTAAMDHVAAEFCDGRVIRMILQCAVDQLRRDRTAQLLNLLAQADGRLDHIIH